MGVLLMLAGLMAPTAAGAVVGVMQGDIVRAAFSFGLLGLLLPLSICAAIVAAKRVKR